VVTPFASTARSSKPSKPRTSVDLDATSTTQRSSSSQTETRYTIEIAPSPNPDEASRGVVATGAVGTRYAGWLRLFRYEIRCWRGGSIPDLNYAVGGPRRLSSDPEVARRLLDLVAMAPTPVWGRDELKAGEMWNSNSLIAFLVATAGLPTDVLHPPAPGRAPGWDAGLELARRERASQRGRPAASARSEPQLIGART
jgi:hypothetical protein